MIYSIYEVNSLVVLISLLSKRVEQKHLPFNEKGDHAHHNHKSCDFSPGHYCHGDPSMSCNAGDVLPKTCWHT